MSLWTSVPRSQKWKQVQGQRNWMWGWGGEVGGEEAIFSNRTSVVRNRLPSLKPKQCLTLTPHHIFRVLHTHLGEPPTFMHRTKGLCVVRLSPKLGIVCGTAGWCLIRAAFLQRQEGWSICFCKCPSPPRPRGVPPLQKVPLLHSQGLGTGNTPELRTSSQNPAAGSALWNAAFRWENRRTQCRLQFTFPSKALCSPEPTTSDSRKEQ